MAKLIHFYRPFLYIKYSILYHKYVILYAIYSISTSKYQIQKSEKSASEPGLLFLQERGLFLQRAQLSFALGEQLLGYLLRLDVQDCDARTIGNRSRHEGNSR